MTIEGVTYIGEFIHNSSNLFVQLVKEVAWDERMTARKTASFGVAYNYSQMSYPYQEFPDHLDSLRYKVNEKLGFLPNNCLINYYLDGKSKMGFHSDQIDILADGTGVVIVSLGHTRTIRFRKIEYKEDITNYELQSGSLLYMSQEVQQIWQHSIPKSDTNEGRISLTFRKLIEP